MPSKPAAIALRAAWRKSATRRGISSVRSARGADTSTMPSRVKVWAAAVRAVDDTGALPPSSDTCEMRPTCHSCSAILPPAACTASVTRRQPATCSGVWMPQVAM